MSDFEMDIDGDSDEDTQTQLKELEQLRAVLHDDQDSMVSYSERTAESCPSITEDPITNQMTDDLSKIEMAIALNKFTDEKLQRLEKILVARLRECKEKLKSVQSPELVQPQVKPNEFRFVNCGKPYFKDRCGFPAPPNDDTILMKKSEMYDFTSIPSVPGWTVKDKTNFINVILKMSQNIRAKELNSKIAHLKRQAKSKKIGEDIIDNEIEKLRKQLECLDKTALKDLALPLEEEYDWDTIANKLSYRHSPHEYRALWKLFLHPSINKSSWSQTEHKILQKLSSRNLQDWDRIAKELNTGRTGYQCFVYYRTNMSDTCSGHKWSKEEEEYLKRVVEFYREDNYIPWGRVAASMENRTKVQIYNKFIRIDEYRKGRFIPEEDAVILSAVEHFGIKNDFRRVQQFLPSRSVLQLRNRYQVLCKNRVSTVWSVEEDKKLVQYLANQEANLSHYSKLCKHFPGKDRSQLRARHKVLLKWIKRYPNLDLSYAPRRGSRRLGHGQATEDLNNALENLKNRIEKEVKEKKSKTVSELSSEHDIEDAIVAVLVTEAFKMNSSKRQEAIYNDDEEDDECEELSSYPTSESENKTNIEKLLILLRSNLNKKRFTESKKFEKHFGLSIDKISSSTVQGSSTVQVKCYSRKKQTNEVKILKPECAPDLWGNNKLGVQEYVLPPHLATIIGCRSIMSYVKDYGDPSLNTYIETNRKKYKKEFLTLMDRFNLLFLWPVLLSNESPTKYIEQMRNPPDNFINQNANFIENKASLVTLVSPSITIPKVTKDCFIVSDNIDLPPTVTEDNKNNVTLMRIIN